MSRSANPWAICTAAVGRKNKAKYERCVKKVKARVGRNPAVSAVWPKLTSRQRWSVLEFAGISEPRARAYSGTDWIDLPDDVKLALLRGWHMGDVGGTRRREKGETTRRIPVLTNPVAKPFGVHGSHSYLRSFKGGGWSIYEGFDNYADALDMATWLMKEGVPVGADPYRPGSKNILVKNVQTVVLKPVDERRYTVYWRRSGKVAAGSRRNPLYDVRIEQGGGLWSIRVDAKNRKEARRKANWVMHSEGIPGGRIVEVEKMAGWPKPYASRGMRGPEETYFRHGPRGVLHYAKRPRRVGTLMNPGVRRHFKNSVPEWLRTQEAFYKKFGFTVGAFENAISRLSKEQKQELHRMIDKGFPEAAVWWVMKAGKSSVANRRGSRKNATLYPLKTYFVAKFSAPGLKRTRWMASDRIEYLPSTVVGKVYKVAARSARAAITEASKVR